MIWGLWGMALAILPMVAYLMGRTREARAETKFRAGLEWRVRGYGEAQHYFVKVLRANGKGEHIFAAVEHIDPDFEGKLERAFKVAEDRRNFLEAVEDEYDYRRLRA